MNRLIHTQFKNDHIIRKTDEIIMSYIREGFQKNGGFISNKDDFIPGNTIP